jgi:salicylate hydroxylase
VSYPLARGLRNIVAVEERAEWAEEGWNHADDPDNLRRAFAEFAPEVRGWLAQVRHVHLWGLFRHPVAARWHDDRRAILGDAAHPTLPFLAQGANMALEDAWVLADRLDRLPQADALVSYQQTRRDRVSRVIAAASANARNYHLANPLLRAAAHAALRLGGALAPAAALRRFDWIYGHDATAAE